MIKYIWIFLELRWIDYIFLEYCDVENLEIVFLFGGVEYFNGLLVFVRCVEVDFYTYIYLDY